MRAVGKPPTYYSRGSLARCNQQSVVACDVATLAGNRIAVPCNNMSAIPSLLRVMTLRGAEAMMVDAGKSPLLRRRGNLEPLTTGAIGEETLMEFLRLIAPEVDGQQSFVKISRHYVAEGGNNYDITIERGATGLRLSAKPTVATVPKSPTAAPVAAEATLVASVVSSDRTGVSADHAAKLGDMLSPMLQAAKHAGASDVWVPSAAPPRMRVNGSMKDVPDHEPFSSMQFTTLVEALLVEHGGQHDIAIAFAGQRARVNMFRHLDGVTAAIRIIADEPPTMQQLHLPSDLAKIAELRDGLVLFCGPTGSGKSTSLAALVAHIDSQRAAHIVTLEDPIEYRFRSRRGLIHQREIGSHCVSFAAGLRAALRESPDVILLGELRDRETIAAALTAAETGHLVLATLHAPSAAIAVDRIIDAFPEAQSRAIRHQLAAVLRTVVTQYLLPKRHGGRIAAIEYVPVTAGIANIIRKGELQTLATAISSGRDSGMIALERSLALLVETGHVAPHEAKRIGVDNELMNALLMKK
jgi:twitching motility protein PilT